MPKNRVLLGLILISTLFVSFNYLAPFKNQVLIVSNSIKLFFIEQTYRISNNIKTHFNQENQIEKLQKQVEILKPQAELSTLLAAKLNQLLNESNLTSFNPRLKLSRVISYEELDNPFRVWLDLPNYDKKSTLGLVHKGFTAGVIYPKNGKALGCIQLDKRVVFSVLIGESRVLGVVFGNEKNLLIKYIPSKEEINIGDEVVTSGADSLFYEGIKVGKVVDVTLKNIYKIATVEPYMKVKKPNFFYAVEFSVN